MFSKSLDMSKPVQHVYMFHCNDFVLFLVYNDNLLLVS